MDTFPLDDDDDDDKWNSLFQTQGKKKLKDIEYRRKMHHIT